jgi:hypothetical protein
MSNAVAGTMWVVMFDVGKARKSSARSSLSSRSTAFGET